MSEKQKELREEVTDDDWDGESKYISIPIGTAVSFKIAKMEKVTDPDSKYNLSGTDHKFEITTSEDKIFTINSWVLFTEFQLLKIKLGNLIGATIKITHTGTGKYLVEVGK